MPDNDLAWRKKSALITKLAQIKHLCKEKGVAFEILEQLDSLENLLMNNVVDEQTDLSAQLSVYPLRQSSLLPTINEALEILVGCGLNVIPGSMSTIILGNETNLWAGLHKVFSSASERGEVVMIVTISNACPQPESSES